MPLSFGIVVACNNLLALKNFSTFLHNYRLFGKQGWVERFCLAQAHKWVYKRALLEFEEMKGLVDEESLTGYTLQDFDPAMFGLLQLALKGTEVDEASRLFMLMSATELQYAKIKNPRCEAYYVPA